MANGILLGRRPMEVTVLPRERNSKLNVHHLIWAQSDMRQVGLNTFATMGCTKIRAVDSMTHTLIHQLWSDIPVLSDTSTLKLLRQASIDQIDRHEHWDCSCRNSKGHRFIDAFTLEPLNPRTAGVPRCAILKVDKATYSTMLQLYVPKAKLFAAVRSEFELRCQSGNCSQRCNSGKDSRFASGKRARFQRPA